MDNYAGMADHDSDEDDAGLDDQCYITGDRASKGRSHLPGVTIALDPDEVRALLKLQDVIWPFRVKQLSMTPKSPTYWKSTRPPTPNIMPLPPP